MDTSSQTLEALLRVVHEVEWSMPGSSFNLTVRYVGDDHLYQSFPPVRENPFTETGLRDPALGNSGPIEFSEIEAVAVLNEPRHHPQSDQYQAKYSALFERAASIPGVSVGPKAISFTRRVVP
jgi:hypothetical protein